MAQLGVAEHTGPFCEAQVGGDDHAGFLIQLAEQMLDFVQGFITSREFSENP